MVLVPNKRIDTVDILKGIAILLVVFGHAMQRGLPDYLSNPVWRTVYAFHMPLFMLTSGYVVGRRPAGYGGGWLGRRALALIVPFFAWHAIYYYASALPFVGLRPFIDYSMSWPAYMKLGVLSPANGLWYLWVLFLCSALITVFVPLRRYLGMGFLVPAWLLVLAMPTVLFGIGLLKWYFVFFGIGFAIRSRFPHPARLPAWAAALAVVGFAAATVIGLRYLPLADPPLALSRSAAIYYGAKFTWATLGIGFTWVLADLLARRASATALKRLGIVTIEVYVCHLLFLNTGLLYGWIDVLTTTVFALVLGIALSVALDALRPLRGVLFGRWWSGSPYSREFWSREPASA